MASATGWAWRSGSGWLSVHGESPFSLFRGRAGRFCAAAALSNAVSTVNYTNVEEACFQIVHLELVKQK